MELESILFGSDSDQAERNGLTETGTKTNSLQEGLSPADKRSVEEIKNETSCLMYPNKNDDDMSSMQFSDLCPKEFKSNEYKLTSDLDMSMGSFFPRQNNSSLQAQLNNIESLLRQ